MVIGGSQATGFGFVKYSQGQSPPMNAKLVMPDPQDTMLTTIGGQCNARWDIVGHTDLIVHGNELLSECRINAPGKTIEQQARRRRMTLDEESAIDAVLTVDFGFDSTSALCTEGYTVELDVEDVGGAPQGVVKIDGVDVITFGRAFKDILLIMSNCADEVYITRTYDDISSLEIVGGGGDDLIYLGNSMEGFESQVYPELIIDAGDGFDKLIVDDRVRLRFF